jgi:hypothetical protein
MLQPFYPQGKNSQYPHDKKLDGSTCCVVEKISSPFQELNTVKDFRQ